MHEKKAHKSKGRRRVREQTAIPFTKLNYQMFAVAVLLLFGGYWALSQPPVDGFLSLTLAPILLVIGYCVIIPLAILLTGKSLKSKDST